MGRMKEVFQRQQEEDLYYGWPEDRAWTDAEMERMYQGHLSEKKHTATGAATTGSTNNAEGPAQNKQR